MAGEVLAAKFASPLYCAVMIWSPTFRSLTVNDAVLFCSVATPSDLVPSKSVTVPVGWPGVGGRAAAVTVKVTGRPRLDGFTDDVTVTDAAGNTRCDSGFEFAGR